MKNKRGHTVVERMNEDIEYIKTLENKEQKEVLAIKALGAADFAIEFGLISYEEWEKYISELFTMI